MTIPKPQSPFSPAMEGFQTILLAGAVDRKAAVGILDAFDETKPSDGATQHIAKRGDDQKND